nr:PAS domain-containing protein [Wenjunlia vitaminophila]
MSSRPSRGAARLAAILDALPDALLLVNCNGTVVNANAIALETFETPGTALVGRGLLDLLPTFDSKRIPGSMRRADQQFAERTRPTRMVARRTDGVEFPVEVTSANLEDPRTPYAQPDHYTGDELLMLVVRDLTGTLDTEAELARQQRQTEMILRAAAEGVVGVDVEGKVVLVNPSAAQILGYRASDLGGQELHPLIHHSRADGSPLPAEESPLSDTLRSGRKHRVRGVVLWRKDGKAVPVDLTTAPVRDGDQLVGAVMTFTDRTRFDAVNTRNEQLKAVLESSLRGPLNELRQQLTQLAADPAGQLWPEANQILHHLAAGYGRMTTLVDNVLAFQRLESGEEQLDRQPVGLDEVVAAGVEGAIELIGPGRAQYAVHAPPVEVTLDGERMAQALAHLIADTVGVDATGLSGTGDSTVVVAAAQRGEVARIEVRGPHGGGHPVHLPLARSVVDRHGGVLQVHEVPGQGSAYVVEVPLTPGAARGGQKAGPGAGADGQTSGTGTVERPAPAPGPRTSGGPGHEGRPNRPPRQRQAPPDSALALPPAAPGGLTPVAAPALPAVPEQPTGRRRALRGEPRAVAALPGGAGRSPSRARSCERRGSGRQRGPGHGRRWSRWGGRWDRTPGPAGAPPGPDAGGAVHRSRAGARPAGARAHPGTGCAAGPAGG